MKASVDDSLVIGSIRLRLCSSCMTRLRETVLRSGKGRAARKPFVGVHYDDGGRALCGKEGGKRIGFERKVSCRRCNLLLQERKRGAISPSILSDILHGAGKGDGLLTEEQRDRLICGLTLKELRALRFKYVDGLIYAEVGRRVGLSGKNIGAKIQRSLRHLDYRSRKLGKRNPDLHYLSEEPISSRLRLRLWNQKISTLEDAAKCSRRELLRGREFGYKSLDELEAALAERGLSLREE